MSRHLKTLRAKKNLQTAKNSVAVFVSENSKKLEECGSLCLLLNTVSCGAAFVQLQAESFPLLQIVDHIECYIVEVTVIEDNTGGSGWDILLFSVKDAS